MKSIFAILFITSSVHVFAQTHVSPDTLQVRIGSKLDCSREKALLIMNDKKFPCDSLKYLRPEDIEEIQVLGTKDATRLYGNVSGMHGAIIFTTKKYAALQKNGKIESEETKKP